ncbi:MAG: hypothetical protein HY717_05980 [Planctomycetes bacterium]|nr:hypothetical protein [Planctomycetota bacterium]
MGNQKSLSFVVALWPAIAIALSMGIYAVLQYFLVPNVTLSELLLNHLWRVLVLGSVIYLFLWLILKNLLFRPLQQIYLHLYAVGTGRLKELVLPTTVREIQTLVEGVNLMIRRIEQGLDMTKLERAVLLIIRSVTGNANRRDASGRADAAGEALPSSGREKAPPRTGTPAELGAPRGWKG